jgi:hypothetical protein
MSLQSDILTALASLGADKVWPQAVPADVDPPFVVYRVLNKAPETTLNDSETAVQSVVVFESYAEDYQGALDQAAAVEAAIVASGMTYYRDVSPGEDYLPLIDGYMEPVFFGFWTNT